MTSVWLKFVSVFIYQLMFWAVLGKSFLLNSLHIYTINTSESRCVVLRTESYSINLLLL